MKYYISYFYKIRFFPPNLIPVSTAVWDPKWYHAFQGNDYIFVDKRGVVNGIRMPMLNPSQIYAGDCTCGEDGFYKYDGTGEYCNFMKNYYEYLTKHVKLYEVLSEFEKLREVIDDADVCLMVHEATSKPCGERKPLIQWFADNGLELKEWN